MPFETRTEKVIQERRIRVCARCRREIGDADNRGKFQMAGSMGGSLAGSMGASRALGAVLGPIGMIGGAIAGSLAGSKAGVKAGDKACELSDQNIDQYCSNCRKIMSEGNEKKGTIWDRFVKRN
jgi:phage tail tape-measure protein